MLQLSSTNQRLTWCPLTEWLNISSKSLALNNPLPPVLHAVVSLPSQLLLYTAQRSLSRGGGGAAGDPRAGNYPYGNYPGYGDPRQDPRMYRQQQVDPRLYRQGDPRADPRFRQDPR